MQTGPAYLDPQIPLPPVPGTTGFPQKKSHIGAILLVIVAILFLAVGAAGFAIYKLVNRPADPKTMTINIPPVVPKLPPIPPITKNPPSPPTGPEAPPAEPSDAGAAKELDSLAYPGAEKEMNISGSYLQMNTSDNPEKVSRWYAARLHVKKDVNLAGAMRILKGERFTVILTGGDGGTAIMISPTKDSDD